MKKKGIDGFVVTLMVSIHPLHATLTRGRSVLDWNYITLRCIAGQHITSELQSLSLVKRSLIITLYWSPSEDETALGTGWDTLNRF